MANGYNRDVSPTNPHISESFCRLGALYVSRQAQILARQTKGARKQDCESIHQTRVACRRLREALKVFAGCFGAKRARRWRRKLRRMARRLGPARDADVQARRLEEALAGARAAHRPGIERLALRVAQDRQAEGSKVVKAIDKFTAGGTMEALRAAAKKTAGRRANRKAEPAAFDPRAREEIITRLEALREQALTLEHPEDLEGHHRMRICAKRLRYTLEMFRPAFGRRLDETIRRAKELQTLLGDLHDCDVWTAQLRRFLEDEQERMVEYCGDSRPLAELRVGIDALIAAQQDRRRELFRALRDNWDELLRARLWEKLAETLARPVRGVAQPPSAVR